MTMRYALAPALMAFASCAMAQGTVSISGFMDVAMTYARGSVSSNKSISSGNWSTSRIVVRGLEDLGGGYRAGFWMESLIFADTGEGGATNTNNQPSGQGTAGPFTWGRRSTVSLFTPWGEVRAGRDLQPHYLNMALYDPFAHIGIGQAQLLTATVAGANTTWVRASNAVHYLTPNTLDGWLLHAAYFLGENPADNGTGHSMRVGYEAGAVRVGVGRMQTRFATGKVTHTSLSGCYDFGTVEVMATWVRDRVEGPPPDGRGWEVGLRAPLGAHELKAQLSRYASTAAASPRSSKASLGYAYHLSKRTALYGIAARIENDGGASRALAGSVAGPNGTSTGMDVGVRHIF